jgi:hypothetical protein
VCPPDCGPALSLGRCHSFPGFWAENPFLGHLRHGSCACRAATGTVLQQGAYVRNLFIYFLSLNLQTAESDFQNLSGRGGRSWHIELVTQNHRMFCEVQQDRHEARSRDQHCPEILDSDPGLRFDSTRKGSVTEIK